MTDMTTINDVSTKDESDAGPMNSTSEYYEDKAGNVKAVLDIDKNAEYYNMSHKKRGLAVIFNNKNFDLAHLPERKGTGMDADSLQQTFQILNFEVIIHNDLSASKMLNMAAEYGEEDHEDYDCFVCCILTHGDDGILYGTDGKFPTDSMFQPFRGDACPTLAGKPKIFIIQACRGTKYDPGVKVLANSNAVDSPCSMLKIPVEADFLIAYSTVPGYFSWRNTTQGSWFVQAITEILNKHGQKLDLLSMFTMVNLKVAYDFISCARNPEMDRKKQVPCITSMLTRKILFTPKM